MATTKAGKTVRKNAKKPTDLLQNQKFTRILRLVKESLQRLHDTDDTTPGEYAADRMVRDLAEERLNGGTLCREFDTFYVNVDLLKDWISELPMDVRTREEMWIRAEAESLYATCGLFLSKVYIIRDSDATKAYKQREMHAAVDALTASFRSLLILAQA
jgi:hypothetical protein